MTALGVLVASQIVPGISAQTIPGLLAASLLLGVFNAFLRPIMLILSLPLLIITLGLFTFVVNALLLMLVGNLVKSFHVDDFWAAFWGGVVISIVAFVANGVIGKPEKRPEASEPPQPRNPPSQRKPPAPPPGKGPIIDV